MTTHAAPPATTDLFLLDELLTPDERAVRDRVRAWCDRDVLPVINDYWERAEFPAFIVPALATLGIVGGNLHGYGCAGLSAVAIGLVARASSRC
jgi:glutaryl-CoA dehydrogenase